MELLIGFALPLLVLIPIFYWQVKKNNELEQRLKELKGKLVDTRPPSSAPPAPTFGQINVSRESAQEILRRAQTDASRIRREAEQDVRQVRTEREELARKLQETQIREKDIENSLKRAAEREKEIEAVRAEQTEALAKLSLLTKDEARRQILENVEKDLNEEVAKRIRQAEEKIREESGRRAKEILVEAMRHGATDYVAEYTVSVVKLPDEEIKGRIIGKDGRNIRSFELITGVDVDLDEPREIRISCFDPVRREIARVSLEKLVADGRIQPARIEEIVDKTKKDIERLMHEAGEKLAHEVGAFSLPLEIIDLLGRFKYRFSYGQNMIAHTLEETKIGLSLAHEVGADVEVVRLGCLLHDIGKVITEDEGTHVQLGADLLRRFKFAPKVVDAVAEHHEDKPFSSVESVLVYVADAISGARPGARVEDIEAYVRRMTDLEKAALSFKGVKSAYAISAGREVRVIAEPLEVDDAASVKLAHDIAQKIEKEQTYPGQVKVTVIRETRASGIAK
ncbi:MAG: ribonuclease Y [Patescibacteria group bacterium]|nr:ribonuclease Y [Patescibacteria group bacterium]